mgnify:CR=1 FL=1
MKTINTYIIEKLKISKNKQVEYILFPKDIDELEEMILHEIEVHGKNCSLNHIDVSKITDMSYLFYRSKIAMFNGNISEWDVSSVTNMHSMFMHADFNGDISEWDVSNVTDMRTMFYDAKFNGDISGWDVSNVKSMVSMFSFNTKFNQDISRWKINNNCKTEHMFDNCSTEDKYKPYKNSKRIE